MSNAWMTDADAAGFYGADATEWLARWDSGVSVWSVEMGGLGPGYEQCIQITAAEALRVLLRLKPNTDEWKSREGWAVTRDAIEKDDGFRAAIKPLGLSGAQFGAAVSLATTLYKRGPASALRDVEVKDRLIQVQRSFPSVPA